MTVTVLVHGTCMYNSFTKLIHNNYIYPSMFHESVYNYSDFI